MFQPNSSSIGVERPNPRRSTRTTRKRRAKCGTQPRHASVLSASPCTNSTVGAGRHASVKSSMT
jgi:hypothetical protein